MGMAAVKRMKLIGSGIDCSSIHQCYVYVLCKFPLFLDIGANLTGGAIDQFTFVVVTPCM